MVWARLRLMGRGNVAITLVWRECVRCLCWFVNGVLLLFWL